jgi:hypothetical protein
LINASTLESDMKTSKRILAILLGVVVSSYAASQTPDRDALLPVTVVQGSSLYIGKEVSVEGYLRYGGDARGLWTSRRIYRQARDGEAGPEDAIWSNCVTLNADDQVATHLRALDGKRVLLTGIVSVEPHADGEVFSFSCNDVALKVSAVLNPR